jgi:hypothetical protein
VVSVTPRPRFTPGERTPGTHCTGGWVGPRAGLDKEARGKILCRCRDSNPDRPVVQPVVRHYTAWANPTPNYNSYLTVKTKQSHDIPMEAQGERIYSSYSFTTSVLVPAALYPRGKDPGTHWTRGWVGPWPVWTQRLEEKSLAFAGGSNPYLLLDLVKCRRTVTWVIFSWAYVFCLTMQYLRGHVRHGPSD